MKMSKILKLKKGDYLIEPNRDDDSDFEVVWTYRLLSSFAHHPETHVESNPYNPDNLTAEVVMGMYQTGCDLEPESTWSNCFLSLLPLVRGHVRIFTEAERLIYKI